mgnify:CR=1 FL=1
MKIDDTARAKIELIKLGFHEINQIAISDSDIEKLPDKELERYYTAGINSLGVKSETSSKMTASPSVKPKKKVKKNSTIWGQSALAMGFTWLNILIITGYAIPILALASMLAGLGYIIAKLRGN